MYVLFKLTAIFPKSKMAAVSHIGYVPIFKNHQICIEITTQTYSDHFWSPVIAWHVTAKGFMFNQSITCGHLGNNKMAKIPYSSDHSCPNEGFSMPKWYICTYYLSWLPSFRNPRWPPSAILDLVSDPKMIFLTSKWPNDDILCIFWPITCPVKPVPRNLWLINQSLAAILKTSKWLISHIREDRPVPMNTFCQ